MTTHRSNPVARALLAAGLLAAAAAARAAGGYIVTPNQESLVSAGMTASEVKQALGRPARQLHYRNEPGLTYTYQVIGYKDTVFDVDFDANGRVASVGERIGDTY